MKFLKKLKSSNFWVSMISAVVLIAQSVFNIEISSEHSSQIVLAILGVLVMSGIISDNSNSEVQLKSGSNGVEMEEFLDKIAVTISNCIGGMIAPKVDKNESIEQVKAEDVQTEATVVNAKVEQVVVKVEEEKIEVAPIVTIAEVQPVTSVTPEIVASTQQPRDVL